MPVAEPGRGRMGPWDASRARIAAINESATLAVDAKAKALKAAGENVIGFGAGEPDFPTPAHDRRGRGRGVPRAPLPPLLADAGPARAARGDRAQDQARLRRRLRGRAGARHQRRQARGLQHVPGAAATRATRCCCPRRTGPRIPRRSRSAAACRSCCPTTEADGLPRHDRAARGRAARRARRCCCSCRRATRPARSTRPTRSRRSGAGRSSAASGSSPTRSTSTSPTTITCSRRCPTLVPELADTCVILNGVAKTYAMTGLARRLDDRARAT